MSGTDYVCRATRLEVVRVRHKPFSYPSGLTSVTIQMQQFHECDGAEVCALDFIAMSISSAVLIRRSSSSPHQTITGSQSRRPPIGYIRSLDGTVTSKGDCADADV
jgi:hypothetical protein